MNVVRLYNIATIRLTNHSAIWQYFNFYWLVLIWHHTAVIDKHSLSRVFSEAMVGFIGSKRFDQAIKHGN